MEKTYDAIQKEILKGSLQERLGYDLFMNVMNHPWDKLPEKYKEKFEDFMEKEGEVLILVNQS